MSISKRWKIAIIVMLAAVSGTGAKSALRWWSMRRHDAYAAECRIAREECDWDGLQRLAGEWCRREPYTADPWLFLAEAGEGQRDWPATADALAHIPDTDSRVLPALIQLAKLDFGPLNRPFEGEEACKRLLRLEPRATYAHQRLIQFYALSLQREKLVQQIRSAIDHRREPPEAYVYLFLLDTLRLGNGVEANDYWLEAHPDRELFVVARAMHSPEPHDVTGVPPDQIDAAVKASAGKPKAVEALLEKYPANLELLAYEIERCKTLGDSERVSELLSRAPESAARDSRFWDFKGWLHETFDDLPEAEAAYRQALEIHPLDWNAWNRLAGIYRRRHNLREVERLTALVEQARKLRIEFRKLAVAESASPEFLEGLSNYARNCGADWLADALDRRVGTRQGAESQFRTVGRE